MQLIPTSSLAPKRHDVPLFIRLGDTPVGRTRNLSANGVFVETSARPPLESRLEMCLAWGESTYYCVARIVRHAADGIGLTFEDQDAFFTQAVEEILADTARPGAALSAAK